MCECGVSDGWPLAAISAIIALAWGFKYWMDNR